MSPEPRTLTVAGLFAGIGGIERGLAASGHDSKLLCELDPHAREVLATQFDCDIHPDVTTLRAIPHVDLLTAGFPCQDLSLAGTQRGLDGERSGLVSHVFRLIRQSPPEFVLLENVLYLVKRQSGALMRAITKELEDLGYRWAYRVVDTRGFGLPQRRQRVIILASRGEVDPASVLFRRAVKPDVDDRIGEIDEQSWYGFYWTEGKRAVGWAKDAVPTIKGGSGLSIPSPPALFDPGRQSVGTPSVEDGERLQGFEAGWTDIKLDGQRIKPGKRWTLIGNAVSVPVAEWLGEELALPSEARALPRAALHTPGRPMPFGAMGTSDGGMLAVETSLHVNSSCHQQVAAFLQDPLKPLSVRASAGFLRRVEAGIMTLPQPLLDTLERQSNASL